MNSSQQTSAMTSLAMVLAAVFSVLVAMGKLSSSDAASLQNAILAAVGGCVTLGLLVWKLIPHSNTNKIVAASTVPGVTVTVAPNAAPPLVAVANDNSNAVKLAA